MQTNLLFHKKISIHLFTWFIALSFLAASCRSEISSERINWEHWKKDKLACNNYRAGLVLELEALLPELRALNEYKVLKFLGQPDQEELLKRSQKEFFYYLEPGEACKKSNPEPRVLWIRFGAIGNVSECLIKTL